MPTELDLADKFVPRQIGQLTEMAMVAGRSKEQAERFTQSMNEVLIAIVLVVR